MQTPTSVLARHGHIATRTQLLASGLSGTDLTRSVRLGEIRRIRRAHYATPGATKDAADAVRVGGKLAGLSAARSFGLWAGLDERLHVAVAANASRLRTNYPVSAGRELTPDTSYRPIVIHWIEDYASAECWRVPMTVALSQVVEWADRETAIACLDTALTKFSISTDALWRMFAAASPATRLIVAEARPGSDAGTESIVRQRLSRVGIECIQQVRIAVVGRVDMVVKGTRVVIEVDGRSYHSGASNFEEDRRRTAELVALGYVVVRLSYERVMFDWPWCERMVLAALSQFRR